MKHCVRLAIFAAIAATAPHSGADDVKTTWTMAISTTRVEEPSGPVVEIWAISFNAGELVASCRFANLETKKYKPAKLTIDGDWRDGNFWPAVKAQVSDLDEGPWYSIPVEAKNNKHSKIEILPGQVMPDWQVKLNDFLPYVGNYAVGRVIFSRGDYADFELINLKGAR
jgi:hypothetical protein